MEALAGGDDEERWWVWKLDAVDGQGKVKPRKLLFACAQLDHLP